MAQRMRALCAFGFLNIPKVPLIRFAKPLCSLRWLSLASALIASRGDGPQQAAGVAAGRAAQRMHRITHRTLKPTRVHPVVDFGLADQRLNGLLI